MLQPEFGVIQCGILEDGQTLKLYHQYWYQVQQQKAVLDISRTILILFTDKGIHEVECRFDSSRWLTTEKSLMNFFTDYLYPAMVNKVHEYQL